MYKLMCYGKKKEDTSVVLHILYSGLGGHGAVLFALIEGGFLSNAQHVILFAGVEQPIEEYIKKCEKYKLDYSFIKKDEGKNNIQFQISIVREIIVNKPDIIFIHGLATMPAVAFIKLICNKKKPYIIVRETQANMLKSKREWMLLFIAHIAVDKIVHLSKEARDGTINKLGKFARYSKVKVVPNGLDTEYFIPIEKARENKQIIHIGMQSRLQTNKDHNTLIKAFYLLCKNSKFTKYYLHIAGDGVTFHEIVKMIKLYKLENVVSMHGMLDKKKLKIFLCNLDIYVHCTHGETMSTAIMQAQSCGLPVIASDVHGVSNMVLPDTGLLYEPGNAYDLKDKIEYLIDNPEIMQKYKERARVYALEHYTIASMISSYSDILRNDNILE